MLNKSIVIFFFAIVLFVVGCSKNDENNPPLGERDFIAFWSGGRAFAKGENPYQSSVILEQQQAVQVDQQAVQAFLNPPWSLALFAFFSLFDLEIARIAFAISNIFLFFCLVLYWIRREQLSNIYAQATLLLNIPFLYCLWVGQLSVLVTASLAIGLILVEKNKIFLAGVVFGICALKPHLFIVTAPICVYWIFLEKKWKLLTGAFCTVFLNSLIAYGMQPKIFSWWRDLDFNPALTKTSTLANFFREALVEHNKIIFESPLYFIPIIGICISFFLLGYFRLQGLTFRSFGVLLPLSLLFAPYALLYDYSMLLITQFLLARHIEHSSKQRGMVIFLFSVLLQVSVLFLSFFPGQNLRVYIYYPLCLGLLAMSVERKELINVAK